MGHARRTAAPIIDLTLLRIRTFSASTIGGALFFLGTVSSVFALALLLQLGFGLSAFQAGLITLASAAGSLLTRYTFRPILRVFGFRQLLIWNALLTGAFLASCGLFTPTTPYVLIIAILFIGCLLILRQYILPIILPVIFTAYLLYGFIRPRISRKVREEIEDEPDDDDVQPSITA